MAVENVTVNSTTDLYGNAYTTAVSNDQLTNDDFLKLMLEEMKMQDPTKPMDSAALMDSQLQMSNIETNQNLAKSMEALSQVLSTSSLSTAMSFMGKTIEDGSISGETGIANSFKVKNVESKDGNTYVIGNRQIGFTHNLYDKENDNAQLIYDTNGKIYTQDSVATGANVKINDFGKFEENADGTIAMYDDDGIAITDSTILARYAISTANPKYEEETTTIDTTKITKVYG